MQKTSRLAALILSGALVLALPTGCSDDGCEGKALHPDLDQEGADSPIGALEDWLSGPDTLPDAPSEDWTVIDSGEANPIEVVIENDEGDGWWVLVSRTTPGGWVVSSATDDATGCEDELSSQT